MPSPSLLYTQMLVTQLQTRDTRGLRPTRPKSQVSQDTTASSPRRQHEHDSWCTLPPCRTGTSLHPLVACVNTACMHEPIQSSVCRRHVCLCLLNWHRLWVLPSLEVLTCHLPAMWEVLVHVQVQFIVCACVRGNTARRSTFAQPMFSPVRQIGRNTHAAPSEVNYGRTNGFYHVLPL